MADARALSIAAPPPAAAIVPRRTLRLTLAYDGAPFHGWQVQPDAPTVQGHVLSAARPLFGEDARLVGASRTDAGVHALRQTASLTGQSALLPAAVVGALNAALPPEIRVLDAADADPGFDARRHAAGKRYLYLLDTGAVCEASTDATISGPSAPRQVATSLPSVACARCTCSSGGSGWRSSSRPTDFSTIWCAWSSAAR